MSCNNFLSINNNIITVKGINTNDVWNITVINANFMLSKYNGRGPSNDISIIPFPNVGDGLYGDIAFSVNNNSCFKDCITNVNGDGSYFNVSPKYVTLHEKDETYNITVSSDCENFTLSNENIDLISTPNSGTNYFTITSNTNASFENIEIIVTNNCNGLEEIVYVSQKPSQEDPKLLTVNPQYINLSGDDKDFKINVISMCNGNTDYTYDESVEGITLNKDGNIIYGTITSTENIKDRKFTVSNNCYSKTVTVNYSKEIVSETYICIDSNKENCTSSTIYNFTTGKSLSTSYTINSSSNWYISTYDSNKVNCSKSGNNIIISLGNDRSECENEKIILKNKDGNEAIINYSVGAGLDVNDNIIFTFADGSKKLNLTADTDYSVSACVIAYKNDNNLKKPIKWVNNSSGSFKSPFNTYSGGTDNCVNVKFTALPIIITTQSETTKEYTITLQEQETYKTIEIDVSVTKQCENKTIWTGLTVAVSASTDYEMGKCETILNENVDIKVTANGINTNDKCESGETSITLTNSDYDVIYNPSGANETEEEREVLITFIGKGYYINTSGETIVTQEPGPCTEPPTYDVVYEWDYLHVTATNMGACDEESVLTIIAEGTKTNSDGTDEDVEEDVSGKCKVTYNPSGTNKSEEEREVTITIKFEGIVEEVTVYQEGGCVSYTGSTTDYKLQVLNANMAKCDTTVSPTVQGASRTVSGYSDGSIIEGDWSIWSDLTKDTHYTLSYNPSLGENNTFSVKTYEVTATGIDKYAGKTAKGTITQAAGPCKCTAFTTWDSISVTDVTAGKCSTSASMTVTASGTKTNTDCTTVTTSTTLTSSDYTVKYGKINGSYTLDSIEANETTSEVTWYYKVTASSVYESKTATGSFKQEKGKCTPDPVYVMQKTSGDTSTSITFPGDVTYDGVNSYGYICCYSTKDGANQSVTTSSDSDWLTVESNNSLPYNGANYNFKFTCTKNTSTSRRTGKITITQSGSNKTVTWTITQSGKPQSTVYSYTFKNCYSDRQLGLFASNASPSGSHTKYAMLSAIDGQSIPVNIDSIDGIQVNGSSNSMGGSAKIGDNIKVYSVQGQSWKLEETITLTAENRSFEYGCVDICSSVKVTCSPSQVTSGGSGFTNNGAKTTITVTGGTTNKWSVISTPEVDNTTSNNNSGTIYIGYKFGTYTIQSDECPEKTCTFKILKPEIRGIRIANNQPGTAKIYKTTQNTGKVLLGTLSNRGQEQVFNVTFDDHGTLDIEYESNNWRNDPSCYVYVRVEGDNLIQIGDPIKSGIDIIGGVEGATISANMNGSCSGSFATASGYYTIMINIKYAGYPCTGC